MVQDIYLASMGQKWEGPKGQEKNVTSFMDGP